MNRNKAKNKLTKGSCRKFKVPDSAPAVPIVKVQRNDDGTYRCPRLMTREQIRAAIRADRDRL